jgi:hypothetical protein
MTNVTTLLRCARTVRHCTSAAVAAGLILISAGCHDAVTSPPITRLAPAQAPARSLESPSGGGATFSVSGEAPLAGSERDIGRYPTPTVVAMTVQQDFAVVLVQPGSSNAGRLGLAGRISAFGCTHQGEAYLVNFPDEGDFGFPFAGCQLAASPTLVTAFTDTVVVNGLVRYGYGFDAACPYPDSACASYSGSSGVSLSRLPATLGIFGDSVKDGTLRAWPRREYTLVAAPAPARLGRHPTPMQPTEGGWTFTPDSGSAQTDACDNGSGRVCTKTFQKSGFLTLVAIVNGARMTSPPIRVETPAVALALSADSVTVGDVVVATTTVIGLDTTALSYFYVSAPTAAAPAAEGLSPCVGTTPVPTRCYLVFTQPGRALVEVGASLDIRRGLSVNAQRFVVVSGNDRKVTLSVARRTIEPTARYWRFDTETKQYTPHPTRQPDTSRTVVTVSVADAAGKPIPNLDVVLSLEAREKSAGHDHVGRRPTGIFQTLAREPLPGGVVNTGLSGVAKVYFVASEVSGPVQLQGVSANAVRDTITVDVRIADLVALGPGPHYVFTGAVEGRHTDNHYGTHAALAAFRQFADSVNGWIGEPLGINDISLQWGGLFDVGGEPWAIPHGYHRRGTHADIRTRYASRQVFSRKLQERMRALWRVTLHLGIPVNEADHLHLNFYP